MVVAAIGKLSTNARSTRSSRPPCRGIYQVIASGQMVYVSADGKYMFNGDLMDLNQRKNLSDAAWAGSARRAGQVAPAQSIVFAPAHPKYTVTVFTDVNCGFCRALHEHDRRLQQGRHRGASTWPGRAKA